MVCQKTKSTPSRFISATDGGESVVRFNLSSRGVSEINLTLLLESDDELAAIAAMTPSDHDLELAASPPPAGAWQDEDWSR